MTWPALSEWWRQCKLGWVSLSPATTVQQECKQTNIDTNTNTNSNTNTNTNTNTNDRDYLVRQPTLEGWASRAANCGALIKSPFNFEWSLVEWVDGREGGRASFMEISFVFFKKKDNRKRGLCVVLGLALILLTPHLSKEARQKGWSSSLVSC